MATVAPLARMLSEFERRLRAVERGSQIAHSSVTASTGESLDVVPTLEAGASAGVLTEAWRKTGTVEIDGGHLSADSVEGGSLKFDAIDGKTITGARIRTAATGARVEVVGGTGTSANEVRFYLSDAALGYANLRSSPSAADAAIPAAALTSPLVRPAIAPQYGQRSSIEVRGDGSFALVGRSGFLAEVVAGGGDVATSIVSTNSFESLAARLDLSSMGSLDLSAPTVTVNGVDLEARLDAIEARLTAKGI